MQQLATSPAADPSLAVQMEDQNRLAMESGTAAFELNYPFVYPSMKADQPDVVQALQVGAVPERHPGQAGPVTIGGIDLAVSTYSQHPQLAFQAALCLRNAREPAHRRDQGRPAADAGQPLQQPADAVRLPVPAA